MKRKKIASSEQRTSRNTAAAVATGVVTVGAGYLAHRHGLDSTILQSEIVPEVPNLPVVVDGMIAVNEGIRAGAPVLAVGAVATMAYYSLSSRMSAKNKVLTKLSKTEYSGVDDIQGDKTSDSVVGRGKEKVGRFRKGTSIAMLSIALTGSVSGLEHEISNGPLRPIDSVASLLAPEGDDYTTILQGKNNTFMDDSVIDPGTMEAIVEKATDDDIVVVPFNKELMNINDKSALQISLPDGVFENLAGVEVDDSCDTVPVIVDETVNTPIGGTADINSHDVQVVSVKEDMAQMNRSIAIVSDTDMKQCLKDGADSSYFGAFVQNGSPEQVKKILRSVSADELAVVSEGDFRDNNRDFWRNNGTPIILILMGSVALLGGYASANERKNALQRNVKEIGIMQAAGVDISDIRAIEDRRALSETFRATLIAAPFIPAAAAVFNAAETGLRIGAGPRELAVGSMITLGSKMVASRRAVKGFENNLDLSQAVKG